MDATMHTHAYVAVYNHWTGLLERTTEWTTEWTTGMDDWTDLF